LVAVSFGPDSMALLDMLHEDGYNLAVAHVNYHKRPQSNLEQSGLEQYCIHRDIPLYVLDIDQYSETGNFQGWARQVRYRFFANIATQIGAQAIITAHHRDDHIETILLQKKRKTMSICMGICEETTLFGRRVLRPLLPYSKSELIEYCAKHGVDYAVDQSNLSDAYERNKIRHHEVTLLNSDDINRLLKEADDYNLATKALLTSIQADFAQCKLPVLKVVGYDERQLFLAVHLLLKNQLSNYPISKSLLSEMRDIAHGSKSHWRRHLRGDYWLVRSYDTFEVIKFDIAKQYSYKYEKPSRDDTPYFFMDFTSASHRNLAPLECYPITIRNTQPGDYLVIAGHRRLLRRLFIDWKLPRHRRNSWPVMLDKDGNIIFVPRYRPDFNKETNSRFFVK